MHDLTGDSPYKPEEVYWLGRWQVYGYARAVAGVAPGKKVVGIVGIGMLVLKPKPLARSFGILAAE